MLQGRARRPKPTRTARDPERTREALLQAAFRKVYRRGFNATDLDTILAEAGVTKGALYHHFDGKEALGHAIVDEIVAKIGHDKWLVPLRAGGDPIDVLIKVVRDTAVGDAEVFGGCPLNNLAQELSAENEGFRKRLARCFADWQDGVADALKQGRKRGQVSKDVNAADAATFLVATYEGYISLAKAAQDAAVLESGKRQMVKWLEGLRPEGAAR